MSNKKDIYEEFLIKFTEEILLLFKLRQEEEERKRREERLRLANIEAEKLRMKLFKPELKTIETNSVISPTKINVLIQPQPPQPTRIKQQPIQFVKKEPQIRVIEKNSPIQIMKSREVPQKGTDNEYGIDFGRLIYFILNPRITYIDCAGPNKDITIKAENVFKADITLNKEEIESIIKSFSERARIPLIEGMLKARIKDLEIAAIVSVAGSSFILKRYISTIPENPLTQRNSLHPVYQRTINQKPINQKIILNNPQKPRN